MKFLSTLTLAATFTFSPVTEQDKKNCPKYRPIQRLTGAAIKKCASKFIPLFNNVGIESIYMIKYKLSEYKVTFYHRGGQIPVRVECINAIDTMDKKVRARIVIER